MYYYQLVYHPDIILYQPAHEVSKEENITDLVAEMKRILIASGTPYTKGVGLAANQVGVLKRVIVMRWGSEIIELINPRITSIKSKLTTSREGCLSCPNVQKDMRRYKAITVVARNLAWEQVTYKFRGMSSFIAQHELDHLEGITILGDGE